MRIDKRIITGLSISAALVTLAFLWPQLSTRSCQGFLVFMAVVGSVVIVLGGTALAPTYNRWRHRNPNDRD